MPGPVRAVGLKIRFGNYKVRIWWTGMEIEKGSIGRVFLFPWNKSRIARNHCDHCGEK